MTQNEILGRTIYNDKIDYKNPVSMVGMKGAFESSSLSLVASPDLVSFIPKRPTEDLVNTCLITIPKENIDELIDFLQKAKEL